jgi:hypothetical protein
MWTAYLVGLLAVVIIVLVAVYVLPAWLSGPPAPPEEPAAVVVPPPPAPELVKENTAGTMTLQSTAAKKAPEAKPAASFPT